jgi:C4-type Zn-finger protein
VTSVSSVSSRARMARMRECPLCGETMRLSVRDVQDAQGNSRQVREWICPECDYFEEAETSEG